MILHANWARELQIPAPKFSSQFPILHVKPGADSREHLRVFREERLFPVGNYPSPMVHWVGS